jgi:hypothetical protein
VSLLKGELLLPSVAFPFVYYDLSAGVPAYFVRAVRTAGINHKNFVCKLNAFKKSADTVSFVLGNDGHREQRARCGLSRSLHGRRS